MAVVGSGQRGSGLGRRRRRVRRRGASGVPVPAERYATAHLAALRGAAAVLAARTRPTDSRLRRRRPTSAWVLLTELAPELGEWAAFFAAGAGKRAAAEAGVTGAATTREADDLVRDVGTFLALVETTLGLVPTLPLGTPRAG